MKSAFKWIAVIALSASVGYALNGKPAASPIFQRSKYSFEAVDKLPGAMFRTDTASGELIFCMVYKGEAQLTVMIPRNYKSDNAVPHPRFENTDPLGDPGLESSPSGTKNKDPYEGLGIEEKGTR